MKRIAILTSGGDSPAMNAAIRAAAKVAFANGLRVFGIRRGYAGMYLNDIFEMNPRDVSGIIDRGGTFLLTARFPEFKQKEFRERAIKNLKDKGIEALVVIGGDGSYRGANDIFIESGIKVVGLPGTIDNDIAGTDYTIGYDTALNTAVDAISKIRDTATSHERTYLIEVMGRSAGYLALYTCMASGGDGVLIPERGYNIEEIASFINERKLDGKLHSIIVVAEGVGNAIDIAKELESKVSTEIRVTTLGHIQRGGTPSALDRINSTKMGAHAVEKLINGESGIMIGIESNKIVTYPISHAWEYKKDIDEDDYRITMTLAK